MLRARNKLIQQPYNVYSVLCPATMMCYNTVNSAWSEVHQSVYHVRHVPESCPLPEGMFPQFYGLLSLSWSQQFKMLSQMCSIWLRSQPLLGHGNSNTSGCSVNNRSRCFHCGWIIALHEYYFLRVWESRCSNSRHHNLLKYLKIIIGVKIPFCLIKLPHNVEMHPYQVWHGHCVQRNRCSPYHISIKRK